MINHDQVQDQDEVKTQTTEEETSVKEEQVSMGSALNAENESNAKPAEETSAEPMMEETTPPPKPQPAKSERDVSKEKSEMEILLEQSTSNLKKGQIVEGVVVDITDKEVMVDIGYKSEGVIPISEFAYSGIPGKNEVINVYISEMEDGEGKIHLSKKRADFILNIQLIKEAFEQNKPIKGVIRRRVKGGMIVDVLGIEAFLPGSQMSVKPVPNLDQFIGKELTFKIVNLDEERRNIILSRKKVLEEEMAAKRNELLSHIEVGAELEGEVKNITQYGAFIDLGGVDGLLHLSDMSWGKINHPAEMLNIGDKLKVKVINYDPENGKISLGLKQLVPHPWEHIEIKYPEGTHVSGKVVSVKSYGAFVEIEPGVEGLVHISEMSWTKKITDARRVLKVNDTVNAIVLELDKENKRISLGMKQMEANPWLTIEERYPVGTVLTRKIKSLTNFGAFVELEDGIDGLIHISDISWTKRIYHPKEVFKKNQEVEAIVLSIDRALHRVALGIKQLRRDPWEFLPERLPVNTEVKGKISKLIPKGVLVDIPLDDYIIEGFVPISHLAIPKLERSEDAFHVGEELPLKVIELDIDNRRLIMSVKAFFFSRDPKLQEEYIALHEQYMRERIARLQRKKAEKEARQRDRNRQSQFAVVTVSEEEKTALETTEKPAEIPQPETETLQQVKEEVPVQESAVEVPLTESAKEEPILTEAVQEAEPEVQSASETVQETQSEPIPQPMPEPESITASEPLVEPQIIVTPSEILSSPIRKKAAAKKKEAADTVEEKPKRTTKAKVSAAKKATATKKISTAKPETVVKKTVKAKAKAAE